MKPARPDFVAVAEVLGPHGVQGRVKVRPLTDFPDRLRELREVRVTRRDGLGVRSETHRVTSVETHGDGSIVIGLEGCGTREQAAKFRGARLEIPTAEVRPLPPGRYYHFQVVGLVVRDEGGRVLGRVRDILETGANDVFVVAPDGAGSPRDEILLPALKSVILSIDAERGEMVVRPLLEWSGEGGAR